MIIQGSGFGLRVSRKYGNVVYRVYLGIIFPYSVQRTSQLASGCVAQFFKFLIRVQGLVNKRRFALSYLAD